MIAISELKHNAFRQVDIPKASDLFAKVGERVAPASDYSGDDYIDPNTSKIAAAKEVAREVEQASEQADKQE